MASRILVIEDNPTNLELMIYLLKAFGHATVTAADGEQGIETARRTMPDLILCDIALPKLDGFGVARRLKADAVLCAVPLIAVTASAMVGDRDKVLEAGFDGYIAKPISVRALPAQLAQFLPGGRDA